MGSGATLEAPAAEVPGSQVPEWYEADGKPVPGDTQPVWPQIHRQGGSYYYHFPSPGQRLAGELDASGNGGTSPLVLTVSRETVSSGSPVELGGGQRQGGYDGGQQQQQGGYDGGQQHQQQQGNQQHQQGPYYYPGS